MKCLYSYLRGLAQGSNRVVLLTLTLWLLHTDQIQANVVNNLSGLIDISSSSFQARIPTGTGDSLTASSYLSQEYSLSYQWAARFSDMLSSKASLRYATRGIKQAGTNFWNSDLQPSTELTFSHSRTTIRNSFSRRITYDNNSTSQVNQDYASSVINTTIKNKLPLNIRLSHDRAYDKGGTRDNRNTRLQATSQYSYKQMSLRYSFSNMYADNRVAQYTNSIMAHNLNLSQTGRFLDNKLRLSSEYTFNFSSQVTDRQTSTPIYQRLTVEQAIFGIDNSPEFGSLDDFPSLNDGDTQNSAQPPVEIGSVHSGRNIGVELGLARELNGLHVYTNSLSGDNLTWEVYISDNNLDWLSLDSGLTHTFDILSSRYEIYFPAVATRFIKVVNTGINSVDSVLVTEIQAVYETGNGLTDRRSSQSHIVDISSNYQFNDRLRGSANISYNRAGGDQSYLARELLAFHLSGRYTAGNLIHSVNLQTASHGSSSNQSDSRTQLVGYKVHYRPLPTFQMALSISNNQSFIARVKTTNTNNIYLNLNGHLFPGLNITTVLVRSWNELPGEGISYRNWSYRLALDGSPRKHLSLTLNYNYQHSIRSNLTQARIRNQYALSLNYRLTSTIFIRGRLDITDEQEKYIDQDYSMNWILSSRLTFHAQTILNDRGRDIKTNRYSLGGALRIRRRASLTFNYIHNDLNQFNIDDSTIYLIGFKTSF